MRGRRKVINSNFSSGELDPRLVPLRSDVQAWQQGLKQMVNLRPLLHGGAQTRNGTAFCGSFGEASTLVPFEFSETQGYVLAMRNGAIDIWFDNGSFCTTVTGTPWTLATTRVLRYAQAGDTVIFTHNSVAPHKLTRTGASTFVLVPLEFAYDTVNTSARLCPFYRYAPSTILASASATTGVVTVNLTTAGGSPAAWFTTNHVGTRMRIGGKQLAIQSFVSAATVTAMCVEVLGTGGTSAPTLDWDEEAFSPLYGWPHAVCFHNERLVFGGSLKHPSGLWASQVGDFFNFDLADGTDDKAIWIGVAADKVVSIQHLASFKHLTIFTDQVELYQPEGDSQPWSPKTAAIKQQTGFGCHPDIRPVRFDEAMIFVQKYGHHVREFLYDAVAQNYSSDALSVMNPSRIVAPVDMAGVTASRTYDEQYAYVVMADGGLALLHSLRAQRITSWAYWQTQGQFRQVCAVNGNVFFLVERVINGATVYYLELLYPDNYLDSVIRLPVTVGGTSVSGITHLENVLAQAVNNGYAHEPDVVSGGVYQLVDDVWGAPSVAIGLPYGVVLESMPPEIQTEDGSSRGRPLRIVKAGVQVHESVRLVTEGEGANITNIDDDYSVPPDPQTGMYDFVLLGFDRGKTVTVRCDVPLPLTVLGLALEVVV
jgi:hypothetical protein